MRFDLPTSVALGDREYAIRSDYRVILDIICALSDAELTHEERAIVAMTIFYVDFDDIPGDLQIEALKACYAFIAGEDEYVPTDKKEPTLVDWKKDFKYIVSPVNKILGKEIREIPYDSENNTGGLHWWTFLAAYLEIGDCLFAQIVNIRSKKARGKPLDKSEREWYRRNRELVDIETSYTEAEQDLLKHWGGG